jgi:hypothetical protein
MGGQAPSATGVSAAVLTPVFAEPADEEFMWSPGLGWSAGSWPLAHTDVIM